MGCCTVTVKVAVLVVVVLVVKELVTGARVVVIVTCEKTRVSHG